MMQDYTKMEESNMQQQNNITGLEQTCQNFREQQLTLEEKGQYVTNTFTTTCDYLVLQLKFCPLRLM
jgi:hypothetical protein